MRRIGTSLFAVLMLPVAFCPGALAEEPANTYRDHVQPLFETYCYGCHGYGSSEGNRTLDEFASEEAMLADTELWHAVLKNVRSHMMPPAGEDAPTDAERRAIEAWIKSAVFRTDAAHPDPGRVTLRRLNRVEYRNTIRDLMGVDYDTTEEFPPDDTGYGFDTIGDVLTMSPLLMEKYAIAAEKIVDDAMPTVSLAPRMQFIAGRELHSADGRQRGETTNFYDAKTVAAKFYIDQPGEYRVHLDVTVHGGFFFDPGRNEMKFSIDGRERFQREYKWEDDVHFSHALDEHFDAGDYAFEFQLRPLAERPPAEEEPEEGKEPLDFHIRAVRVEGPLDETRWVPPANHARFYPDGIPPAPGPERDAYARRVLERFATRAFRRPVEPETLDRLTDIAVAEYSRPGRTFEEGIARAAVFILSSPQFLFRVEDTQGADPGEPFPLVDEYALVSRLSYFLWSTMPDEELTQLAAKNELRANLPAQIERMVKDERSRGLVQNFVGQWLQTRDVEITNVNPIPVLGLGEERGQLFEEFMRLREERHAREDAAAKQAEADRLAGKEVPPVDPGKREERSPEELRIRARLMELRELEEKFDDDLWRAMRRETEMSFAHVIRKDRSVLELLDADYTFLNEQLAEHYGIPGVEGGRMRLVKLPEGSPRGGVLTQGTMLVVTSNPTRTSPVKRGLFVLDNILGTPAPPPPGPVPELEASADAFKDHEPTLRELLERHRADPLCSSCHARMDPLGLALENFNALGMWRDQEHGQSIHTAGQLITGEEFANLAELKKVLVDEHRLDFYRCLTEKLLTYALGRGMEYHDEHTIDTIVERLDAENGRFSVLLAAIIDSAPFQRRRAEPQSVATAPHANR